MSHAAILAERVSKRFRIGVHPFHKSLGQHLRALMMAPLHRLLRFARGGDEELWALQEVSFEVHPGEVLGIIGRNGAGKSTLLKVLSRIIDPTDGEIRLRGRVNSLLEVGTGFHPELTGRENVYMNAAILGMTRLEIRRKFDEIVEFSGVERFIDTPVKRYSSGMQVRLAFAVAAHIEPEILVVDEVLAVGDAEFQKRCLGKMRDVAGGGRTVLFVSHNMQAVKTLCTRGILLHGGRIAYEGAVTDCIHEYRTKIQATTQVPLTERRDRKGTGRVRATRAWVADDDGRPVEHATSGVPLNLVVEYASDEPAPIKQLRTCFGLYAGFEEQLAELQSDAHGEVWYDAPSRGRIRCRLPRLPLNLGLYSVTIALWADGMVADYIMHAVTFEVIACETAVRAPNQGYYVLEQEWVRSG